MLRRLFKEGSPSPEAVYIAAFVAAGVLLVGVLRLFAFSGNAQAGAPSDGPVAAGPGSGGGNSLPVGTGGATPGGVFSPVAPLATAAPIRIEIPAIRVSSNLLRVGLNADHTMQVPTDFSRAAWYTGSAIPGNPGPTVIVGHVDSYRGPAVFFNVKNLPVGSRVTVWRADGAKVNYVVQRIAEFPKDDFPTRLVYGSTPVSTLRLVTCGGDFNRATGHYVDNIIAFATIT